MSRTAVLFSPSRGLSPVVLVSRLLRLPLRAERALVSVHRDGRRAGDNCASRAVLAAAVEQGRHTLWCSSPLLLSSCAPLRARHSLAPPARRRGRAHHERTRGARNARRDARGARGVRAPRALGARGPCVFGNGRPGLRSFQPPYSARAPAPSAPFPETTGGRGRADHERARDARARSGAPGVRGFHGKAAFPCRGSQSARVLCHSSPHFAPRCSLAPRRGRALRASGHATHARPESRVSAALVRLLVFASAGAEKEKRHPRTPFVCPPCLRVLAISPGNAPPVFFARL